MSVQDSRYEAPGTFETYQNPQFSFCIALAHVVDHSPAPWADKSLDEIRFR